MIGPLSSQLNAIKWGEFKLGDLFEASNGDFDIQKRHINHKGEFVITAGLSNNGVLGQSDIKAKVFESHTITIDMFGCAFYRSFAYKMVTHARVFSLKPKFEINHKIGLFLSTLFFGYPKKFGYENMCSWAKIKNDKVILPLKPTANAQTLEDIDFHFMEKFIAELEQCRLAELQAYLKATGLENTTLSNDEENALNLFNGNHSGGGNTPCGLTWQSFKLGDLFEKIIIKPLPYQTAQLPKEKTPTHELPALTAGILNQGLNNFVPKENATILKNVISISANGANTGATFYQPHEFCVLQDAYAIEFIGDKKLNDKEYLFFVCAISKVIYNNSKYEWTNKAGWNKVKNELISLPLKPTANAQSLNDIDFHFMCTLINALMKQTIQGVAEYCDAKIQAAKEVISQETPVQKDSLF
ncbi:restriction endonuclease subunit S [Helicobacter pylori]|uniref:Type IIS restriction enzyme protein n=1 Tax=Helicobacter pylori NQ4053 TaxID=992027 RepID=I9Z9T0_HELPX|nr:restriction endonuclease subunit S [Helicobacter pylori]EJB32958.1 type IIS restriction enzyme protein [Helicobacter pylori NQ4053]WQU21727.1 restriction endonuclease subunit S [Helicobacter pylori]WQX39099.1 restriction endonuclease subunit S [Helicobacter pylori]